MANLDIQLIKIPPITLEWTEWYPWNRFESDARSDSNGITPPDFPGVYEVRLIRNKQRLTIGKTSNLRKRVVRGLVMGTIKHSSGKKIRKNEDTSKILIRWAVTDRPAAVEEELHRQHITKFGKLPKYTDRT